ncbi:MAG: hypothetical protein ACF8Q5_08190 [Phycisphaerales bacterium JB040]
MSLTLKGIPRLAGATFPDAHARAAHDHTPVLIPLAYYTDDRGFSLMNLFTGVLQGGQSNVSTQHPGVVKAWHRHAKQTDFWICTHGHLKVGVHDQDSGVAWHAVIGERNPACVVIPPTLWHGAATVGSEPATLLYYVTHEFDPSAPDEERRPHDEPAGFPWHVQHR